MKRFVSWFLLFSVSAAVGAQSMGSQGMMGGSPGGQSGMGSMMGGGGSGTDRMGGSQMASESAMLVGGEVRKVDRDAQKLTIKHGPLPNLDMPAMTMVFRVKDQSMLDRVKAGDRIRFSAVNVGGALTVTQIELAK